MRLGDYERFGLELGDRVAAGFSFSFPPPGHPNQAIVPSDPLYWIWFFRPYNPLWRKEWEGEEEWEGEVR